MSEFLSCVILVDGEGTITGVVGGDLQQHASCWKAGANPKRAHEVTWPQDDDGRSLRIRALGESGGQLHGGAYELLRDRLLHQWPTRDALLVQLLRQGIGPEGQWAGDLYLGVPTLTAEVRAELARLTTVGLSLHAGGLTEAKGAFPALATVGRNLYADGLTEAKGAFPALTTVCWNLYAGGMVSEQLLAAMANRQ